MSKIHKELDIQDKNNQRKLYLGHYFRSDLGVNSFEEINLDQYQRVIVESYSAVEYINKDFIQQSFTLIIPFQYFQIKELITIDRKNKVLKIYFNGITQQYLSSSMPQNTKQFEKISIIFSSQKRIPNQQSVIMYVKYFPNLKSLSLNMSAKNKPSLDSIKNRIEFLENFKFIENVEILLNDLKIVKKKDEVYVLQTVSSQKKLILNIKDENKIKFLYNFYKAIDLTNKDNSEINSNQLNRILSHLIFFKMFVRLNYL